MALNSTFTQTVAISTPKPLQVAHGRITMPADSITATDFLKQTVGFTPVYVKFVNVTDRITVEWHNGMAADTCVKTAAAGTQTLETTNQGITICDSDGTANTAGNTFKVSQNATLAVIAASKVINWYALG
jgi:hypothetical protein